MSRRSNTTLQVRDSNTLDEIKGPVRKRRSKASKRRVSVAKKHSYQIQRCWSEDGVTSVTPCVLIETPHKELEPRHESTFTHQYIFKNLFIRAAPLPPLSWASADDVWIQMLNKELTYVHEQNYLQQHQNLQANMRSILLDWLLEVSEVYCLHRQTAYLAQDFFDRFMMTQQDVSKDLLQLIGITALFVAAKMEEIYPPKIFEFSYVTDGACDVWDIQQMELHILKALNWNLSPETPISWLKLYSQLQVQDQDRDLLKPGFCQETYIQVTQLLDVCMMDASSLDFSYSVLAAAALAHLSSFEVVQRVSGLTWEVVAPCLRWMTPFMLALSSEPKPQLKNFHKVLPDDRHNIQTHVSYLDLLRRAQERMIDSPSHQMSPVAMVTTMTPPSSTEKPVNH